MRIRLEAGADHVQRLAHESDPVRAIIELIWNSLDADAHEVTVRLGRNEAGGIVGISVVDDGHGMSPEAVESAFHWVGNSWKGAAQVSLVEKRPLHGKFGHGRLRAFALGTSVRWDTVADDTEGRRFRTTIRASVPDRNDFSGPDPVLVEDPSGTTFEASGRDGLNRLDADATLSAIGAALAPYLLAYPDINVVYDGEPVRPEANIERDATFDLAWEGDGTSHTAKLRIIEWKIATGRSIHLCDDKGVPVDDLDSAPAPDFKYSAYVMWADMAHHHNEWILAGLERESSVVGSLLAKVNEQINQYFDERRAEQRRQLVDRWKADNSYPYLGEPQTPEDELERATFDVVATTIRRHIPKARKQEKLTLGLLKDTLQRNPEGLSSLLDQFVGLSTEEKEQLQRLLERTPLARLIRATTAVTNRLDFLAALRHMVFDPEANNMVKERAHLHSILERELWVFGEQFNMMVSERGLTAALRQHLTLLGRDPKAARPVELVGGGTGRLDLMLSGRTKDHDRIRHLVVELKAPSIVASDKEASQIKRYARAVVADPQFADVNARWDFMLIVSDFDDEVRRDISQHGRARGILDESVVDPQSPVSYRVWVKSWSDLIDEAERRLDFYRDSLQHDPTIEDIRDYLEDHHGDVIPENLFGSDLSAD